MHAPLDASALLGILDVAPVALVVTDPELRVTLWNRAAESLFGWSREEILGQPVPLVPPERGEELGRHAASLARGETLTLDTWRRRRDGTRVPVRAMLLPVDGGRRGALAAYLDLSEQRRTESALEARSAELEAIFAAFPDLYFWFGVDNRILAYRAGRRADLAADPSVFIGKRPTEYLTRAAGEVIEAAASRARETGEVQAVEYTLGIDGKPREFEARMAPMADGRVIAVVRNISDRKRTEHELRDSLELLRGVVEGTPDAIFLKDLEGRYQMINQAAADIVGLPPEVLVGRADSELFPEAVVRELRRQDQEVAGSGETRHYDEVLPTPTGPRDYHTTKGVLRDRRGTVTGVVGVSHDVTDFRRLESQLRQSQKMEALGRMAGGVAHDFNNLLTVILSAGELLLRRLPEPNRARDEVQQILEAAERAGSLTRQLLSFSRRRPFEPEVVDLCRLVAGAEKILRRLIGEHIALTSRVSGDCLVRVDPGQLEQVIVNLVVNARDAMPEGGEIRLSTSTETLEPAAASEVRLRPGKYVRLEVVDTGHGMDEATMTKMYDPFFTTKGPGGGTGLGLSTAYGIVRQVGGRISAESRPGEGTRFVVQLPAVDSDREVAPPSPRGPEAPRKRTGTETVLVVEDEPAVRALVVRALEGHGYRVLAAGGGRDALALVDRLQGPLHLLLTDVVMPEMTGREVADALRERVPGVRVLYMSGYSDDSDLHRRIRAGGECLLQKPFKGDAVALAVREALDRPRSDPAPGRA